MDYRSLKRLKLQLLETAANDILAVRLFNAQRKKHVKVAFFFYYRAYRRNPNLRHRTRYQIRDKAIARICKRLHKINLLMLSAEEIFTITEIDRTRLRRLKTMPIIEVAKLKITGTISTHIDLRGVQVIQL